MTKLHNNSHHGRSCSIILLSLIVLLQLCSPAQAQPSPPGSDFEGPSSFSPQMGVIIIILIAALFFMGLFSIYIRHCSEDTAAAGGTTRRRILAGSLALSRRAPRGLDPEVIESFPTFDYAAVRTAQIGKGALECAVCLTEFEDDDTLRLIPKCDHVFHSDCIDQWLTGHTTCPVCRANLSEPVEVDNTSTGLGTQSETVLEIREEENSNSNSNDNGIDVEESESMEQPLQGRMRRSRSMMRNISIGRPRWMGKFTRSLTTGHVAVKQWESMQRFTLRVPEEVRKQIISGKLQRSTSLVVLPRETSSRRGYRMGFGEETSRVQNQSESTRSDRWVFSLAPPFITRVPSIKSPKFTNDASVTCGSGSTRDNNFVRGLTPNKSVRLPV